MYDKIVHNSNFPKMPMPMPIIQKLKSIQFSLMSGFYEGKRENILQIFRA